MTTMHTRAEPPIIHLEARPDLPLIQAYFELNHLKQLFRQGWLRKGIPRDRCESVADHTFGVALLALLLEQTHQPALDALKVLRMALLHDTAEAYAGDLTPAHGIDEAEKHRREREAARRIFGKLPGGETWLELLDEYERQETAEARFVKQLDRLEMAFQASVYEHQELADLGEFFRSAGARIRDAALGEVLRELEALRRPHLPPHWSALVLTREDPPGGERIHELARGQRVLLGRNPPAGLVLPEVSVSRRHAWIDVRDEGAFIRDADSAGGIYLNDALLRDERALLEGDEVRIGQVVLRVAYR